MMYAAEPSTPLGRYRLIALLGQGGMADVYLAATQGPRGFQKLLVVKLARFTGDPVFSTMFLEEARIAAQLEHPNVIQTYEIAEEGSRHYIVMEYLDGGNLSRLRQRCSKNGGIPLRTSLTILAQVLEGLEYAHDARGLDGRDLKVVHRDLSPSNIMVTAQGAVKILDFGIAKATDSYSFTQTGKFSGKLSYMPPEQMRGTSVDARADLFAFGVMLAEAAMNEKLWGTQGAPEVAAKLNNNEIPSLDRGTPIDPMLRAICERALAPDRDKRYATAGELKIDLAKYLDMIGGPLPARELAQFVRTTVADDRAKLQGVVDSQLQKLSASGWSGSISVPDLPRLEHTPSRDSTVPAEPQFEEIQVIPQTPATQPKLLAAPGRSSTKLLALGGVLLALMIVFVILVVWSNKHDAPISTAQATPPPPMTPRQPTQNETVRLEIVVSPANALLTLDGKPLGANPYVGAVARDGKVHELAVSAAGFSPLTQQVSADRDLNLRLNLVPAAVVVVPRVVKPPIVAKAPPPKKIKKVEPKVEAKIEPPVEEKKPPVTSNKHGIDTDVYSKPGTKRSLDSNVLDGSGKPTIDRENPWQK
jgi:eukaryotic-like serine/threonine-protein kinase